MAATGQLFDLTRNFSFYSIPVAWLIAIAPHMYATSLHDSKSSSQKFDHANPRTLLPSLDANQTLDAATKAKITRAEGAQTNGFENLGLFAAAVVGANVARVDSWWLNTLSFGYLATRVAYNVIYISGAGPARTAAYFSGMGMIFALFIQAGNKVRNAVL